MNYLGINHLEVAECVKKSFATYGDENSDNKYLSEDKNLSKLLNVQLHPSLTINNI